MKDLVKAQAGVIPRGQWLVHWMGWAEGTVLPHELWLGLWLTAVGLMKALLESLSCLVPLPWELGTQGHSLDLPTAA